MMKRLELRVPQLVARQGTQHRFLSKAYAEPPVGLRPGQADNYVGVEKYAGNRPPRGNLATGCEIEVTNRSVDTSCKGVPTESFAFFPVVSPESWAVAKDEICLRGGLGHKKERPLQEGPRNLVIGRPTPTGGTGLDQNRSFA